MQPREKLLAYWPTKLEGRELVATILGSGIQWMNVFKLAKIAHQKIEKKWPNIMLEHLQQIKGIWPIKAMQLIGAFELAKRYFVTDSTIIQSSTDVLTQVSQRRNKKQEHLLCLTLDGANRLINKHLVTIGLLNQSLVHPREVFAPAIEERANSIILVHNHPSGTLEPSTEDKRITSKIKKVGDLVGIKLLDHIIITKHAYRSFKEKGKI